MASVYCHRTGSGAVELACLAVAGTVTIECTGKIDHLSEVTGWSIPVGVGIISFLLAVTLPGKQIVWSGWVYFSMFILVPLHSAYCRRKMEQKKEGRMNPMG